MCLMLVLLTFELLTLSSFYYLTYSSSCLFNIVDKIDLTLHASDLARTIFKYKNLVSHQYIEDT